MITTEQLPAGFTPYETLVFCSNNIIGGGHILAVGNILPILIGVGELPRVWLQAVAAPGGKEFVTIVADSVATHPIVCVAVDGFEVSVSIRGKTVLTVRAEGKEQALVSEVDLRPLGLNVFGSSSGLTVGGMQLSRNTFSGVGIAFGLGA